MHEARELLSAKCKITSKSASQMPGQVQASTVLQFLRSQNHSKDDINTVILSSM